MHFPSCQCQAPAVTKLTMYHLEHETERRKKIGSVHRGYSDLKTEEEMTCITQAMEGRKKIKGGQ